MQGTVVMLMALSGLGCHNKSCDVVYAPPTYSCFSGGCYANVYPPDYVSPSCYSGCYSSCYSGCYSGSYSGHHGCGLFAKLFSCFKHSGCYGSGYGCYGSGYGCFGGSYGNFASYDAPYSPPIFGYALQYNYGAMDSYQAPSGMTGSTPMPSEAVPPVPPNPVPSTPAPAAPVPAATTPPVSPPAPPGPGNVVPPGLKPSA